MSDYAPLDTSTNFQALGDIKGLTVRYRLSKVEGVVEHTYGAKTVSMHPGLSLIILASSAFPAASADTHLTIAMRPAYLFDRSSSSVALDGSRAPAYTNAPGCDATMVLTSPSPCELPLI